MGIQRITKSATDGERKRGDKGRKISDKRLKREERQKVKRGVKERRLMTLIVHLQTEK